MKLIRKDVDAEGVGQVTVTLEEAEDMWHLYNLLTIDDRVRTTTLRYIHH